MFWNELEQYSRRTALITDSGTKITYQELLDRADVLGEQIGRRCLVFSMCRNCADSAIGYVGFLRRRIVPVMIWTICWSPTIQPIFIFPLSTSLQ